VFEFASPQPHQYFKLTITKAGLDFYKNSYVQIPELSFYTK